MAGTVFLQDFFISSSAMSTRSFYNMNSMSLIRSLHQAFHRVWYHLSYWSISGCLRRYIGTLFYKADLRLVFDRSDSKAPLFIGIYTPALYVVFSFLCSTSIFLTAPSISRHLLRAELQFSPRYMFRGCVGHCRKDSAISGYWF